MQGQVTRFEDSLPDFTPLRNNAADAAREAPAQDSPNSEPGMISISHWGLFLIPE